MYGTTMKNYSSSKSHKEEYLSIYQKNNRKTSKSNKKESPKTRYMKIDERKAELIEETSTTLSAIKNSFSRKEFPIASVIFTAIATMVILLLTTGALG